MNRKVELLAPAGNYEAFMGALNAGADAVYLGGEKFGARAYADNFTTQEICRALHVAHFMGRKIYLTVNTLFKESEVAQLYAYLLPFYEAGLDGVIVQDLGVFCLLRDWFPKLPLHVSTQMTVTDKGAALFLKEQGAARIVPARELSLLEVRGLKEAAGIEIECFIHGAMCYCYSGQCLFSSILGGRSGNRGRCAQPCRLPYQIYADKDLVMGEGYPLSLKDMCTLEYIPQLIEAGIDSFKIEGRIKKPAYAAGVTAMYRKYMDLYERVGAEGYRVEAADMDKLRGLYIRSEIQTGYYERHNGREMITLSKPGYVGSDEQVTARIQEAYLHEPARQPVSMSVEIKAGAPIRVRVEGKEQVQIEATGEVAQTAQKAPLQPEDVRKQMTKTGNSCVLVTDCAVKIEGDVFVPVRALNQLRRGAVEAYEREVILRNGFCDRRIDREELSVDTASEQKTENAGKGKLRCEIEDRLSQSTLEGLIINCLVTTCGQLEAVRAHGCQRIFIESDLFVKEYAYITGILGTSYAEDKAEGCACYLALPHILRRRDEAWLQLLKEMLSQADGLIDGFLIRNLEGLSFVRRLSKDYAVIPDTSLYCFHKETLKFWKDYSEEYTLPYEVNAGEASRLAAAARELGMRTTLVAYGRIPMMITANCLRKTAGICQPGAKDGRRIYLKDRYRTTFPVMMHCEHCYNIIYNSVPCSLHESKKEAKRVGADIWRYDFVMESRDECEQILAGVFPFKGHTTGHLKRGIE